MPRASRPSYHRIIALTGAMLVSMSGAQHAQASGADAWKEFQQDVEMACLKASSGVLDVKRIQVDPYGSETYGFAIMSGFAAGTSTQRLVVCAYDKVSRAAEVSGAFDR